MILALSLYPFTLVHADEGGLQQRCFLSPSQCLVEIEKQLPEHAYMSEPWIELKVLQFKAEKYLVHADNILREVPFLLESKLPSATTRLSLLISYSKALRMSEQTELADYFSQQATTLFTQVNANLQNPLHFIEYANLMLDQDQVLRAERLLLRAQRMLTEDSPPFVKMELYANLGHIASRRKETSRLLYYRQLSEAAAVELGNVQQIGVAQYNVARSYQQIGDYSKALLWFESAKQKSLQAGDLNTLDMGKMRCVEVLLAKGDTEAGLAEFDKIKIEIDLNHNLLANMYEQLSEKVQAVRN